MTTYFLVIQEGYGRAENNQHISVYRQRVYEDQNDSTEQLLVKSKKGPYRKNSRFEIASVKSRLPRTKPFLDSDP